MDKIKGGPPGEGGTADALNGGELTGEQTRATVFGGISIVLAEPLYAGNVGSVSRVMGNTGFKELRLVNPREYLNDEGFSMACNSPDILLSAREFQTVEEAVRDSQIVLGTTRRMGKLREPHFTLSEVVPKVLSEWSAGNRISFLFGREDHGLNNEELELCDMVFEIPSHDVNPSLNLSQAVFSVCHALFTHDLPVEPAVERAERIEVERLFVHLDTVLKKIGYGEPGSEFLLGSIMHNFRRLFGRAGLMQKEVNMLRGILTQVEARSRYEKEEDKKP